MSFARPSTPLHLASLLRHAQTLPPNSVESILRRVVTLLPHPHPSITSAALELLIIHPATTISYIPDLISGSEKDVRAAMHAFNDILAGDRRLLVPILGAVGELPLGGTGLNEDVRDTLVYAMEVVEEGDLPTVVKVLLRGGSRSDGKGVTGRGLGLLKDGIKVVRLGTKGVSAGVMRVVADVVDRAVRAGRSCCKIWCEEVGSNPEDNGAFLLSPLDLVVWAGGLKRLRDRKVSIQSVRNAVKNGLFDHDVLKPILDHCDFVLEGYLGGLPLLLKHVVQQFSSTNISSVRPTLLMVDRAHRSAFMLFAYLFETFPSIRMALIADLLSLTTPNYPPYTALLSSRLLYSLSTETSAFLSIGRPLLEASLNSLRHPMALHNLTAAMATIGAPLPQSFPIFIRKALPDPTVIATHAAAVSLLRSLLLSKHEVSKDLIPLTPLMYLPLFSLDPSAAESLMDERIKHFIPEEVYSCADSEIMVDTGVIVRALGDDIIEHLDGLGQMAIAFAGLSAHGQKGEVLVEKMLCIKTLVPQVCLALYEGEQEAIEEMKDEELEVATEVFAVSVFGIGSIVGGAVSHIDLEGLIEDGKGHERVVDLLRERFSELQRMYKAVERIKGVLQERGHMTEVVQSLCDKLASGWEAIGITVHAAIAGLLVWCNEDMLHGSNDVDEESAAIVARLASVVLDNTEQDVNSRSPVAQTMGARRRYQSKAVVDGSRERREKGELFMDGVREKIVVEEVGRITREAIMATREGYPLFNYKKLMHNEGSSRRRNRRSADVAGETVVEKEDSSRRETGRVSNFMRLLRDEREIVRGLGFHCSGMATNIAIKILTRESFVSMLCSTAKVFVEAATRMRRSAPRAAATSPALSFINEGIGSMLRVVSASISHKLATSPADREEYLTKVSSLTFGTSPEALPPLEVSDLAEESPMLRLWGLFRWISTEVYEGSLAALAIDILITLGKVSSDLFYPAVQSAFESLVTVYGGRSASFAESYLPVHSALSKRKRNYLEAYRLATLFDNIPPDLAALEALAWAESLHSHCSTPDNSGPKRGEPLHTLPASSIFSSLLDHATTSTERFSLPPLPVSPSSSYSLKPLIRRLRLCQVLFSIHFISPFISDHIAAISSRTILKNILKTITDLRRMYASPSTDIAVLHPQELSDIVCFTQELVSSGSRLANRIKRGDDSRAKKAVPRLILNCGRLGEEVEMARDDMRIRENRWRDGEKVAIGMGMREWKEELELDEVGSTKDERAQGQGDDEGGDEGGNEGAENRGSFSDARDGGTIFVDFGPFDDEEE